MGDKKRKRADEPSSHGKQKKVAVEAGPQTVKVSSMTSARCSPVVATTPGLCLPSSIKFDPYAKLQNAGKKKASKLAVKDLVLHSSEHKTIDYTGREDRPRQEDGLLRHYIGMFDPKTGELQVVEARKVVMRGRVRSQQASAEDMNALQQNTMMDLRTDLGQTFGTKKAKKALVDRVENAITSEAVHGDGTNSTMQAGEAALMESLQSATADMLTREQLQAAVDGAKPLPKGNYDADEIQDVYDPEEIIGADVLNSIPVKDWQEAIKKGTKIDVFSRFVAQRVRRVGEHDESVKRLRIMRYLYFLILFWMNTKSGKKGVKRALHKEKLRTVLPSASDAVIESLRKKFTDGGDIRKTHTDLLMTTCCALASIIDSFVVDTLDLREDLKLEQKQMNQYFQEIGARIRQQKTAERVITTAKLMLPLEFPKMRMHRRN